MNSDAGTCDSLNTNEFGNFRFYRSKKPKKKVVIIALTGLVLLIGCVVACCIFLQPYDKAASSISYISDSEEEAQRLLNAKTENSRLWISVASNCRIEQGSNAISATNNKNEPISVLNNLSENTRDIAYTITLSDGTVLYESDLIKPGQSITKPEITNRPRAGEYEAVVTAQGFDCETHKELGGPLSATVSLTVQ